MRWGGRARPAVDMVAGPNLDPAEPEILVYAPSPSGGVKLAALEYVVAAPAWEPAHPGVAPSLNGVEFDDHRAPEAWHGLGFPHYDLHAWVWEHNPAGVFAAF
ncbi:MAG TPA: hypothetical protein VFZ26_19190 [Gemmatimonadales bacterium]